MRIAIISRGELVSGKEIMTLELGEGMRMQEHSVQYVSSFWNDGTYQQRLKDLGFQVSCVDLGAISATLRWDCLRMTFQQLVRLPRLWAEYRRFLRQERPEHVIHTSWHHLLLLFPWLKTRRDWYWSHEVLPDKAHYARVFRQLSKRLHGFVAVSNAVKNSLLKAGIPEDKIHVIHNGLRDLASVEQPVQRHDDGGIRIGIVGQVEEWKGHHVLLEAFAMIATAHPKAEVHVFGSGSSGYASQLKHQSDALGISNRVFWHGFVADRAQIFGMIDVCTVPSCFEEPFGLVAVEAALFGLPVIASDRGGLPEIIKEGTTGFLVESGNHSALAARLAEMLASSALRHKIGAAARMHVLKHFSNQLFVTDFIRTMNPTSGKI